MAKKSRFHYRIDGGPEQTLAIRSSLYSMAALAIAGTQLTGKEGRASVIEVWIPAMLPEFGPHRFVHDVDVSGDHVVGSAIAASNATYLFTRGKAKR